MEWIDYCKQYIPILEQTYLKRMSKPLNLTNPTTFTEKMQWLKIFDSTYLKTYCTDKITVHKYCKAILGKDLFIPILGIYERAEDIQFNSLPDGVVFKCNHGSGYNIICKPNELRNTDTIKNTLTKWLSEDFSSKNGCELHYKLIPRKILIEPYMNDGHADLIDYKFYCFNGRPLFCQVISDRHTNETVSHYTDGWKYAPQYDWIEYNSLSNIPCPKFYDEMLSISAKLAAGFNLVRVDFYVINNTLYLGELTFTPNSGFHHFKNSNIDKILGAQLKI